MTKPKKQQLATIGGFLILAVAILQCILGEL